MLLFCINNVNDVINSSAGPLLACIYQATNSGKLPSSPLRDPLLTPAAVPASVALQVFPVVSMAFAAQGILTASSRMTYAFARDGGEYPHPIVSYR
jgi:choline transport protein